MAPYEATVVALSAEGGASSYTGEGVLVRHS